MRLREIQLRRSSTDLTVSSKWIWAHIKTQKFRPRRKAIKTSQGIKNSERQWFLLLLQWMTCESGSSDRDWLFLRDSNSQYLMMKTGPVLKILCLTKIKTIGTVHIKNHVYFCIMSTSHVLKLGYNAHNNEEPELWTYKLFYSYDHQHKNKTGCLRMMTKTDVDMSYLFNTSMDYLLLMFRPMI